MPKILSESKTRMHADTAEVLRLVQGNPGSTMAQLQALAPHLDVPTRIKRMQGDQGRVFSQAGRYWAREHLAQARAAAEAAKQVRNVAQPRQYDFRTPWTEPYLSDAGVRRSGLEYREHPSRRGSHFVHCYRKEA